MTGAEALAHSRLNSTINFTVVAPSGVPLAYWGYRKNSALAGTCSAWLLSTPEMDKWPVTFARFSKARLEELFETNWSVDVYVWLGHTKALRWLEWLGFEQIRSVGAFTVMRASRGGGA
jgi:hypothetical protein